MGLIDKVTSPVKKWLWGVALKKTVKRAARLATAWLVAHGAAQYGWTGGEAEIAGIIYLGIGWLKGWVKTKWPDQTGWL